MSNNQNIEKMIESIIERQENLEKKLTNIESILSNMQRSISEEFEESDYDFEIVCPYCENEFVINEDNNITEVQCPECKNTIELDWSFEDNSNCNEKGCPHCKGCSSDEDDDM